MPHIHTEPGEYDSSITAFIVRMEEKELPKLLFHMHKKLGLLLPPGGHVEVTEDPWQATRHEILEETGYDLADLRILQPATRIRTLADTSIVHPQPVVYSTHRMDTGGHHMHTNASFAFVTTVMPSGLPAEGESTEFFWLSLADLRALPVGKTPENVRQISEFILTILLNEWEAVATDEFK